MRKGFQKLAAEILVEKSIFSEQSSSAIITVDDGSTERRYAVDSTILPTIEQEIDKVGDSPEEVVGKDLDTRSSKAIVIDRWIQECFPEADNRKKVSQDQQERLREKTQSNRERLRAIFEKNMLKDPSCIQRFGEFSNRDLVSGNEYSFVDHLIVELAKFQPVSSVAYTTGPGEFAIAFLFGLTPSRATGFDLSTSILPGAARRQYTIKHSDEGNLNKFIYHFTGSKRSLKTINDVLVRISSLGKNDKKLELDKISKKDKARIKKAKADIGLQDTDSLSPLTNKQLAAAILNVKIGNYSSDEGQSRWSLICSVGTKSFLFKAFSISNHLRNDRTLDSKIDIGTSSITILESKISSILISELSRRDRQDVESIARQIAQEVLEDELGDAFDKAVRREMLASLKDKDVESGIADVSRDFMRKFYRSLGTASSSPLDKVKV